jgi:hypothetical protein
MEEFHMSRRPSQNPLNYPDKDIEIQENTEHGQGQRLRCDCSNDLSKDLRPILRYIKEDVQEIEAILTSPRCGLPEIKSEVKNVENALDNSFYGLKKIKTALAEIENSLGLSHNGLHKIVALLKDTLRLLDSPCFGLKEMKIEIIQIIALLENPFFGLKEIKNEVKAIENAVSSPTYGLAEIKSEVAAIESSILDPSFGLEEIKSEVAAIEDAVFDPSFGLEEIKAEVAAIESAVFDPSFGLEEIKTEIIQILNELGAGNSNRSSGPFYAQNNLLEVKVLNNCPDPVGPVTITAYNLATCPKTTLVATNGDLITTTITTITPGCAVDAFFNGNPMAPPDISGNEIEVQVTAPGGLPPCVLIYSRTTNESRVTIANEFCNACYARLQP